MQFVGLELAPARQAAVMAVNDKRQIGPVFPHDQRASHLVIRPFGASASDVVLKIRVKFPKVMAKPQELGKRFRIELRSEPSRRNADIPKMGSQRLSTSSAVGRMSYRLTRRFNLH